MDSKSELLNQLKIDRSETAAPTSTSLIQLASISLLSLAVGVGVTYWWLTGSDTAPTEQRSQVALKNSTVAQSNSEPVNQSERQPVADAPSSVLNASGYITARRMATVSAEVMGLISSVNVEEGMKVAEGDILATIDDELARVNLQYAQAQLKSLRARELSTTASLDEAKINRQRVLSNAYSSDADKTRVEFELKRAQANMAGIIADIETAQLDINRQKERLADYTIRAPFAGVVTVKNAQPGEIVSPSSAGGGFTRTGICTIVDMTSLEIEVDVNESYIGRVSEGQLVQAQLDAYPNWNIPASVIAIIPTADRAKATVRVRIKINSDDARILPDMGVKVAFLDA